MNARAWGIAGILCCAWASSGCGNRPIEDTVIVRPTSKTAAANDAPPPSLEQLKFTLPEGWKAAYDGVSRWKIEKDVPPDFPAIVLWSLPTEKAPADLISFSHKLQTSSALTEGKYILDRVTEQGNFSSGYYVVGRFRQRGVRWPQQLGLAMIRRLGGHTLIFECMKITDPELRQNVLDICKSARF